jgi:hypothetical protein
MRHKQLILSAVLLFALGLTGLKAQEAIPTTAGNTSGSGGSVSYSIGQVVYHIYTGTSGSVAEGVQQPYEISVIIGLEEAIDINLFYKVYPNPVTDILTLKVENLTYENLYYNLIDINGKVLENKRITSIENYINMDKFSPGTYFLKVYDGRETIKSFKIIKN